MSNSAKFFCLSTLPLLLSAPTLNGADLYWAQYHASAPNVQSSNFDGTGLTDHPGFGMNLAGPALDLSAGKMYVGALDGVKRANLDGSNIEHIVPPHDHVLAVALDVPSGKVYWTSHGTPYGVFRANLDGTNIELVALEQQGGLLTALALDLPHQQLYFSEFTSGPSSARIYRAGLDGSNVELVHTHANFPLNLYQIEAMALDLTNNKIYYTRGGNVPRSFRINLDGSNRETLYIAPADTAIRGLVLEVCEAKVYWPESPLSTAPPESYIRRANLDGTNPETVFTIGATGPIWGLASRGKCRTYGDVYPFGVPSGDCVVALDDILTQLRGFANPASSPNGDVFPCQPDGTIGLDDIIFVVNAFSGNYACGPHCPP